MNLQNISEDEIAFMECWYTPACLIESLFHDFDNLTAFSKEKFGDLRFYQHAMVSDESLIDFELTAEQRGMTKKETFNMRKKVGNIYNFGARKFGKCEHFENYCTLASGQRIQFKDLVGKTEEVYSLNTKTLKLEKDLATFNSNGIKKCFQIVTESGKEITVTENHPLLTADDWKQVSELSCGEHIATPREVEYDTNTSIDENVAKILGYLLGDGGCSRNAVGITNINEELIEEIYDLADYFDCSLRKSNVTYFFRNKIRKSHKQNPVMGLVRNFNINCLAKNKTIPNEVFSWDKKSIALLLNRLFACDGHISLLNYSVELTLASEKLVRDVASLLLRFGIHSAIYNKKPVYKNGKCFRAWRLFICYDFDKFLDVIGIKSKDTGVRRNPTYSTSDRIPNQFIHKFYDEFKNKKTLRLRGLKAYNPSRQKCQKLAPLVECEEFDTLANSDIFWDKIKEIKYVGEYPTVSVSVRKNKNYISNDVISHNSCITMIMDLLVTFMTSDGDKIAMSAVDLVHLKQVLEPVKNCLSSHPICVLFKKRVKGSPDFQFETKNNVILNSVNFNLGATNPGSQWYGKHVTRVYIEEASLETEEVYEKRKDALSESGAVFRVSGMCDFTPHSPPGKMFYNIDNKKYVLNLPQFVSPFWDEEEQADREEFYGGIESIGYKVFVLGEVVEDGVSALDMQRIRKACYMHDRKGEFTKDIQRFEISKDTYQYFRNLIVVERPDNTERIFINADIGKKVTEVVVHSEIGDSYEYLYTVVLFNLTQQEVEEVLKHLISKLHANVIGIDCGDGEGRGIYSNFQLIYPETNLVYYDGSMKIKVGFEYEDADEDGEKRIKEEKGEPVFRYEYMSEFSVRRIKELLYAGRCRIPKDYKFDAQFSGVKAMTSGTRTIYKCVSSSGDHLFDAWKVWSIAQWLKKDFNTTPDIVDDDWGIGAV